MIRVEHIRNALARVPEAPLGAEGIHATVAIVLAGRDDDLCLALIERATFAGDVWSGHLALPGGHVCHQDATTSAAAERETAEEIGVVLEPRHHLGALTDTRVRLAGRAREMTLSPIVYAIGQELPPLHAGVEVASAFWAPLAELWDVRNATRRELADGRVLSYPAIRLDRGFVWGITLRALTLFSDVIGHPLPHFEEIPGLRE